jgi:hypothetical protein
LSLPRVIVPLLAAAAGIFGGYALMHKVGPDLSKKSSSDSSSFETHKDSAGVEVVETPSGPPPELKGSDPRSMLLPGQLKKAIAVIEKEGSGPGTKITNFRLAPGRVNAEIDADGKTLELYIIPGGKLYSTSTSPIAPNSLTLKDALAARQINVHGPTKMLRTLRAKSGINPDDVDYFVADKNGIDTKGAWLMYLQDHSNGYYRAALNGAHPQRCC